MYGKELVSIDGIKIRANSSRKNIFTQTSVERELVSIEKKISEYMNELESNDTSEDDEASLSPTVIQEILNRLNEKKEIFGERLKQVEANGGKEISTVDPDAHFMRQGGDGRHLYACYNVQTVVNSKNKLIVEFDVSTCPDDKGALPIMTEAAKEILEVSKIAVVADARYYDGGDIAECEEKGTVCFIPKVEKFFRAPNQKFDRSNFMYDIDNDCYICPEGKELPFKHTEKVRRSSGHEQYRRVYYDIQSCRGCPNFENCPTSKTCRKINRSPDQNALDIVDSRMTTADGKRLFRERKKIVEHPFGTIKYIWGYRQFLCRTREKVTGEQSLVFLAYNLQRVFNILKENGKNMAQMMG